MGISSKHILTGLIAMMFAQDCFCNAHHYEIIHYTKKDGLISDNTFQAEQDHLGYLWIVSARGISKFNGKFFANYTTQHGLPENAIFGAFAIDSGMLFTPMLNKFTLYKNGQFKSALSEIKNTTRNYIFNSYDNFLYISDGPNNQFKIYQNLKPYRDLKFKYPISFVYKSDIHSKELIVYTYNNDSTLHSNFNFNKYGIDERKDFIMHRIINNELIEEPQFKDKFYYYFALQDRRFTLCYIVGNQIIIHPYFLKNNIAIKSMRSISDSIQSLVTNKGIYTLNQFTNQIVDSFLTHEDCNYVSYDDANNMWVTTNEHGLYYIKKTNVEQLTDFKNNNINEILLHRNQMIFSTDSNIVIQQGRKHTIYNNFGRIAIRNIIPIDSQTILFNNSNVHLLNYANRQNIISYKTPEDYKSIHYANGILFGATIAGLKKIPYPFLHDPFGYLKFDEIILKRARINCALEDRIKTIWIGTSRGLYKKTIHGQEEKIDVLRDYRIGRIIENHAGITFFLTESNGIYFFKQNKFFAFKLAVSNENLTINNISIHGDTLIAATNRGIVLVHFIDNFTRFTKVHISALDGLSSNEVNYALLDNNKIYCATDKGISIIHLNKPIQIPAPKIYLEYIVVNNSDTLRSISNHHQFHYPIHSLSFHLSSISFESRGEVEYKYRLQGLESGWEKTTDDHIKFNSLPSGQFTFQAQGINYRGQQSDEALNISFEILAPFWRTWWFLTLVGILLVIGTKFYLQFRIQKIQKIANEKTALDKQFAQLELEAIRGNMNPHFIFNAMNSIHHYMVNNNLELSEKYLLQFSSLMRNVLQQSKENFTTIQQEMEFLDTYLSLEKMRFGDSFTYNITAVDAIKYMEIPTFLIQPFIENCTKHAFDKTILEKHLSLTFSELDENIIIQIEDNGLGFLYTRRVKQSSDHISLGGKIVASRIDVFNKIYSMDIAIEEIDKSTFQNGSSGTIVKIKIPIT